MSTEATCTITSKDLSQTERLAKILAGNLRAGDVIEMSGDLGTGKTALVRLIMHELGSGDEVSSPSFTIENIYRTASFDVHHYDFHRLDDPGIMLVEIEEVLESGDAVVILEWAGLVEDVLPSSRLNISTSHGEDESVRIYEISGKGHLMEGIDVLAA